MANLYTTLEAVKATANIQGSTFNTPILRAIESASRSIDRACNGRRFIPETKTKVWHWPPRDKGVGWKFWLDDDLISVTTLKTKAQNASPTTIPSTDYFLEPANSGPPYDRVEIDLSSTAAFEAGDTSQRSIEIIGSWGFTDDTIAAGVIDDSGGISASDTVLIVSDEGLIGVGDTLLIESEQLYVSKKVSAALGSILINDASVTASMTNDSITVDASHGLVEGERILLDSEAMLITNIATNVLTVIRQYDGTTLAAHADDTAVHVFRTLTVVRATNGTTAATHADAVAITKYSPPFDVQELTIALTLNAFQQGRASYGRTVGVGDQAREYTGAGLRDLWENVKTLKRLRVAAI